MVGHGQGAQGKAIRTAENAGSGVVVPFTAHLSGNTN